jgi:hypothetical protein
MTYHGKHTYLILRDSFDEPFNDAGSPKTHPSSTTTLESHSTNQEPSVPHSIPAHLPGVVETPPRPSTEVSSDFSAFGNDEMVSMVLMYNR